MTWPLANSTNALGYTSGAAVPGIWGNFSGHAMMLPYTEQTTAYNRCNFMINPYSSFVAGGAMNATAFGTEVETFLFEHAHVLRGVAGQHPGGVNAAFSGGSVHFIKGSINPAIWWSLGTRAEGEVISSDSY